ncbi:MAG TPA: iron-sulfur cluster assembly accessory protein [Rhodospirillales bacterium]|nr:iron-sulfur cluster assembly accessory protein [Rhodospirillales bacterium]
MREDIVKLTPAAAARFRHLLETRGDGAAGIRLGVRTSGCSGYSYALDFARDIGPEDVVVREGEVVLVLAPEVVPLVAGTEIDWAEDRIAARFVFHNPNEKARCGCGESFAV